MKFKQFLIKDDTCEDSECRKEVVMLNGYKTVQEISEDWGITSRRIQILCNQDRIPGAERLGKIWLIPENASKPEDKRKKE